MVLCSPVTDTGHTLSWLQRLLHTIIILLQLHTSTGANCDIESANLKADSLKHTLTSPNYPDVYGPNMNCRWTISTDKSHEAVRFEILDLAIRDSASCTDDNMEIRDGPDTWSPAIRRFCGYDTTNLVPLTSANQAITILFKTDGKYSDKGFKLAYWTVPKDEVTFKAAVWRTGNYVVLGIFLLIVFSIKITMVAIFILHRLHPIRVKLPNTERVGQHVGAHKNQLTTIETIETQSCDSVTECITTRTSLADSTHSLTTPN